MYTVGLITFAVVGCILGTFRCFHSDMHGYNILDGIEVLKCNKCVVWVFDEKLWRSDRLTWRYGIVRSATLRKAARLCSLLITQSTSTGLRTGQAYERPKNFQDAYNCKVTRVRWKQVPLTSRTVFSVRAL